MAKIVSIEGNIGVGKSTFIDIIRKGVPCCDSVSEPIDLWLNIRDSKGLNILQAFYDDKMRWSYTFQNIACVTRMMKIEETIRTSDKDVIFLDRSLDTDKNVFAKMLKDDGFISELEVKIYEHWCDFYSKYVRDMSKRNIIYLRCSPKVAYERIIKRGRTEEINIPFEYIEKVHKYHEEWLFGNTQCNILVLDCDKEFENDEEYGQELVTKVNNFISAIE